MLKLLITAFLFFVVAGIASAQDSCFLVASNPGGSKLIQSAASRFPEDLISSLQKEFFLQDAIQYLYSEGYLIAAYSESEFGDTCLVHFEPGSKIYWAKLDIANADLFFLNQAGFREKDFEDREFRFDEVSALMQNMLRSAELNGYPFAQTSLKNIQLNDSSIAAELYFEKNYLFRFDTLILKGNLHIQPNYLEQYTGIREGDLYDQSLIDELDNRLKEIQFATITRSSRVEFSGKSATVVVFLDEKKVSRFDFIVGVLPNNEITGRLIITGEVRLNLENAFGAGETFNMYASKLESTSKQLKAAFTYPYLPKIPFGADASLDLYLKDSTFLERITNLGLIYHFTGSNYMRAFTGFYSSSILSVDTNYILATKTLPSSLDNSNQTYGLAWVVENLNYKFNPRSGFDFGISGSAGTKKIIPNNTITSLTDPFDPDYDFSGIYDSIDLKSLLVQYAYNIRLFIPILRNSTILLQGRGGQMINDQLLQNELYRIGGSSLMRGFDEQSVYASSYHIFTTEYRFLFLPNSFAGIFFDGGYIEDKSALPSAYNLLMGFGAGISLETKAGIFGLSYALGKTETNPVQVKNAKIHFGYINYF